MRRYVAGLVLEQTLGHVTHTRNLQQHLHDGADLEYRWGLVPEPVSGLAARLPVYGSNWTVRAGMRARRTIAELRRGGPLDVLFFHTQVPAVMAADWVRRVPSVISLDATPRQYDSLGAAYDHQTGPAPVERLKWRLNRDCFAAAHSLVTWSEWARQGLVREYGVPAEKVTVLPPGVSVDLWRRQAPRRHHDGPVRILFVGGDLARKGGTLLLSAFRLLRENAQLPEVELHLVTRTKVAQEPGVFVYNGLGPNSDALRRLYHDCDIFCLPTDGDCLPMVLAEAAAAGMPLVSTAVGAIEEVVRDGQTGFLIRPGDLAGLVESLRILVQAPAMRLTLGAEAAEMAMREHDARQNAALLTEILLRAAQSRRVALQVA